jgi:hypothetical protein
MGRDLQCLILQEKECHLHQSFFARLKERGFSHTDPLHVAAERAHDGIHLLWVIYSSLASLGV